LHIHPSRIHFVRLPSIFNLYYKKWIDSIKHGSDKSEEMARNVIFHAIQ
jgi:hypothetical protein